MANWQRREHINDQVLDFYHSHARFPKAALDEVNRYLEPFLNSLKLALQNEGIFVMFKDTGSAFEKVHEPHLDGSLELDIEAVMDGDGLKATHLDMPSSSMLQAQRNSWCDALPSSFFHNRARVSTTKVLDIFENACRSVAPPKASFQQHGPAITMKVMRSRRKLWFAVDIVPAISIPGSGIFVPKQRAAGYMKDFAWRESFSLEELDNYPSDCPWAKPCLRILKALCDRHDDLGQLQSYPLKNLLFWELQEKPDALWDEKYVGRRVWGLLRRLERCLDDGFLPQYFNEDVNLIAYLSEDDLDVMYDYVSDLCENEQDFLDAFYA